MNKQNWGIYIYKTFAVFIGVWIIYRGIVLSITNDEAFTFYNIATRNIKMMCGTANTHWLNSTFIFFETLFLGNQEWMIRIHSFLAFFIFSWALYKITLRYTRTSSQLLIPLALIVLNTYILDFFSLARGYGMSMAFEMLAFYVISINDDSTKKRFLIYLFLALATFSCYTCIILMFAYFLYDFCECFIKERFSLFISKNYHISLIPFYAVCIVAIPNILFIKYMGDLEEGQSNGLILDTFGVFFERSYGGLTDTVFTFTICFAFFLSLCVFYIRFYSLIDQKMRVLFKVFMINILLIECLFFIFKIPYVFGRTALYIDLLFLLLLVYMIIFTLHYLPGFWINSICTCILALGTFHLIFNKNHHTTAEWWKTQGIEKCISDLEIMEGEKMHGKKIAMHLAQLGAYTNYYQFLYNSKLNDTVYSFCENKTGVYDTVTLQGILKQDYAIILRPYRQYFSENNYTVLKYYRDMNSDLIRIEK